LLTAEEMASIQGQPYQEAKPSVQSHDGFTVSQCYFALPTPSDSVVLNLTQATAANAPALRQQWDEMFRGARSRTEKGKQGESSPPRNIPGLGEQAYWKGIAVGGALHVLFGQTHLRISVGGPGDTDVKIGKSEALAKFILKRLQPQQYPARKTRRCLLRSDLNSRANAVSAPRNWRAAPELIAFTPPPII